MRSLTRHQVQEELIMVSKCLPGPCWDLGGRRMQNAAVPWSEQLWWPCVCCKFMMCIKKEFLFNTARMHLINTNGSDCSRRCWHLKAKKIILLLILVSFQLGLWLRNLAKERPLMKLWLTLFTVKGSRFHFKCITGYELYKAHFFVKNVLVTYWVGIKITRLLLDCSDSTNSFSLGLSSVALFNISNL